MIIELFGPPAVGKTTLAYALAAELEANGFATQLIVSSRPAERRSIQVAPKRSLPWLRTGALAPLSRVTKSLSAGRILLAGVRGDQITAGLMDLLPPRTFLRSVRCRRFLYLLTRSWRSASACDRIVIFDQGFMTALCSMALLARCVDRSAIVPGLALIPRPDLLVRLDAPHEVLEARLRKRLGRQGMIERMFEFDLQTSLQQVDMTAEVTRLLQEQGSRIMTVNTVDRQSLEGAVDRILRCAKSWNARPCDKDTHPVDQSFLETWRLAGVVQ